MMKRIAALITVCAFLASCQKSFEGFSRKGYLELSSVEAIPFVENLVTRAVDADLSLEILSSSGESIKLFPAGSSEASGKIELDPGEYSLKAFSSSFGVSVGEGDKGEAIYYAMQPFSVSEAKTTYLTLKVPMINFGVSLDLPEGFSDVFGSYEFSVSCAGRSVSLMDGETAYFDLPSDNQLPEYILKAVNKDGESFSASLVHNGTPEAGTVYKVTYSLPAESLSL